MDELTFKSIRGTLVKLTRIPDRIGTAARVEITGVPGWDAIVVVDAGVGGRPLNDDESAVRKAGCRYYLVEGNGSGCKTVIDGRRCLVPIPPEHQVDVLAFFGRRPVIGDRVLEECLECGATYASYGNVRSHGIGCRRCG
jgi:hypothetical protein